jgi:tetratricopeptide (TPR) repeat protein
MNEPAEAIRREVFNPFVGLRPYDENEAHLFFGRDGQSDELIGRLARTRFLAVVGVSGSGKSSLVRAGLFASLRGGFMTAAGSSWRIALLRPGNAPLANLAAALHGALRNPEHPDEDALPRPLIEATLRRGSLGVIEAVQQARLAREENVLVVVDQFEELFRYRHTGNHAAAEGDAAAFVKLLLEAHQQAAHPIYVMLTMRSDFLGDCAQFRGLPEAMNDSQYLIPRMNRDERRQAIEGPIGVGGGAVSPRLVQRLLNDLGEDPDQLPVLQHALMRTWQHWEQRRAEDSPLDLQDYEAIGTMTSALSLHADEAYRELATDRSRKIAEKVFKRLTERGTDSREIRHPTELEELCAVVAAPAEDVVAVIDKFRNPARSFLMPPFGSPLRSGSVVDISHESLIRKWQRLDAWVDEEGDSRAMYLRVADAADRHQAGKAGLWRNPDLKLALNWFGREQPNAAWAQRYGGGFERVASFLRRSKWKAWCVRGSVAAAAVALVCLTVLSYEKSVQAERAARDATEQAARQKAMALVAFEALRRLTYDLPDRLQSVPGTLDIVRELYDQNMRTLDQISAIAGENQSTARELATNALRMGDQWLRRDDLPRARDAYARSLPLIQSLVKADPGNANWQGDLSIYHERMGNLLMAEGDAVGALREYRKGQEIVQRLAAQDPGNTRWQRGLSISHERTGDALLVQGDAQGALNEYRLDLAIAERLAFQDPNNADRRLDLAISHDRVAQGLARVGQNAEAARHEALARTFREPLRKN